MTKQNATKKLPPTLMMACRTFRPPHLLTDALGGFLRTQAGGDFRSLLQSFPPKWSAFVMGGLVRDLLVDCILSVDVKPADMDIVIFGAGSIDEIRRKLGDAKQSTNTFGGVKCQLRRDGIVFDLWRVEDHTNMTTAAKPHTVEQLLRRNLLDVDAIVWDPAADCLHDCGCLDAIKAGCIGLMGPEGICEKFLAAQVAHVLVIAYKTNFLLSDDVRQFVAKASERCQPTDIERLIERKLPKVAAQIEVFWNDLVCGGTRTCHAPTRAITP